MKTLPILLALLFSVQGCDKESNEVARRPPITQKLVDITVERTSPEGIAVMHKDIIEAFKNWEEVEQENFSYEDSIYYEDPNFPEGIFPWQEGRLTEAKSGRLGTWRYYFCAGFKIRWDDGRTQYFLPQVGQNESTKKPNKPDMATPNQPPE